MNGKEIISRLKIADEQDFQTLLRVLIVKVALSWSTNPRFVLHPTK
jgi:hypothetical protein